MKLVLKNTEGVINQRINITKKEIPCLDSSWHYHAQYELLYISQSSGIRFVGDSVSQFYPGDLVLVGPYLPHLWRNDVSYYSEDDTNKVKTIILKFTKDFIGEGTFKNPEFAEIDHLLEEAKFGVCFGKDTSASLHLDLLTIPDLSPAKQSIKLLDILCSLSQTDDKTVLSTSDMRQYTTEHSDRLDSVLKYISDNYANNIMLEDIANVACMTTNSFCRFFKKMTNKSFTQFLNEVRIRNASRLLVQDDLPVSDVCYMVGYNSITNFNKQFKQIMGVTPKNYRYSI
ncbi:AraC family transcriptional regulator [Flexithrix dorotheae]|uniref:AraC family transcriptional regulator n=1 Tax=Flexithrix dorotheae TaxID=70993 RepID=UPI000366CC71|nr:AraC family transcriptional regulator [Flexithrix dorotheae]